MNNKVRYVDILGHVFGKLTAIEYRGQGDHRQARWLCKCECGSEKEINSNALRGGASQSCGCVKKEIIDLTGKRFGKLIVTSLQEKIFNGKSNWLCKCDCGKEKIVKSNSLLSGDTLSCGCIRGRRNLVGSIDFRRKYSLQRYYKLTIEDFNAMLQAQNGRCAVCNEEFVDSPHVDHDHFCCSGVTSCGKCVRGLLCTRCNTALGMFRDNTEIMESAIHYVKTPIKVNIEIM